MTAAFALKEREINRYYSESGEAGKVSAKHTAKFLIPRFYIIDASSVDVMETQNSLQSSMATSAFSQTTIEASAYVYCGRLKLSLLTRPCTEEVLFSVRISQLKVAMQRIKATQMPAQVSKRTSTCTSHTMFVESWSPRCT